MRNATAPRTRSQRPPRTALPTWFDATMDDLPEDDTGETQPLTAEEKRRLAWENEPGTRHRLDEWELEALAHFYDQDVDRD